LPLRRVPNAHPIAIQERVHGGAALERHAALQRRNHALPVAELSARAGCRREQLAEAPEPARLTPVPLLGKAGRKIAAPALRQLFAAPRMQVAQLELQERDLDQLTLR